MKNVTLREVIKQHIHLPQRPNARGWYPVVCKVCNDHGKKGPRAAFKFDDNDKVAYHCFNCTHAAAFDPSTHKRMPDKMVTVLQAFDVPEDEWKDVILSLWTSADTTSSSPESVPKIRQYEPKPISLPDYFVPLTEDEKNPQTLDAIKYLAERGVDYKDYGFLISKRFNDRETQKWKGRIIIPIYKGKTVVYYLSRDFLKTQLKKYENPPIERDNVIYGFDKLDEHTDQPLYICEGWFDAFSIGGVAVFGNHMTTGQLYWINKSRRPKVVIPDRYGMGYILAEQALQQGWSVSTPDIGSCKDLNEAFVKYGKLYLMKTIAENTSIGLQAVANISTYCRKDEPTRSGKRKNKETSEKTWG